jgi:hypothetical protein
MKEVDEKGQKHQMRGLETVEGISSGTIVIMKALLRPSYVDKSEKNVNSTLWSLLCAAKK